MNTKAINVVFLLLTVFSCNQKVSYENIIAFSCIKCSGCVTNNLNYIRDRGIYKRFRIIIDTSCYESEMEILKFINFEQMPSHEIEKKFGRFGNFILIDSLGKKIEFMTDMNLRDYIK